MRKTHDKLTKTNFEGIAIRDNRVEQPPWVVHTSVWPYTDHFHLSNMQINQGFTSGL